MNKEQLPVLFPGQKKVEEEAHRINKGVDDHYADPRTKKPRSANEVAHRIIKEEKSIPIDLTKKSKEEMSKEERQWYENMQSAGIRILKDGFVEITRWEKTGKHAGSPLPIKQKIDGVNSAIRMQDNILGLYRSDEKSRNSEFSKLESIQEVVEHANDILTSWHSAKQEDKKDLQIQLADVVLQLEHCRNEFKVAVRDQSEAVLEMKDSLGRENPGALAARTVAALNDLSKRVNEMQLIMPIMALRKETLILEKRRSTGAISRSRAHITGITRHAVFHEDSTKSPASRINDNEVAELDKRMGKTLHLLGTIHVLPYSQQAEQAKFILINKVKRLFSSKNKFLENLDFIKEALGEATKILDSDIEHLG
ncbi:MAG: hypothetical protein NT093_02710 [Candidatus Moranbacteria bacterium]|nr:hypothetical protein [Candidatus Moranbacteria bacterium]